MAPETSIDFDAPHIPTWQGVAMWLGGLGFFASLLAGVSLTRPREGRVTDARELPAAIMNATYPRGPV